jgi:uncharacterized protein (DUF433 family)
MNNISFYFIIIKARWKMNYKDRLEINPAVMAGKPVIMGTRITVELLLRKLSEGMTMEELLAAYPGLKPEDIYAVLSYSADVIGKEEMLVP